MIVLAPSEKITISTTSTSTINYRFSFGTSNTVEVYNSISAITVDVPTIVKNNRLTQEAVYYITLHNSGGTPNTVTLYKRLITNVDTLFFRVTLYAGDIAIYNSGDWKIYNSIGELKTTGSGGGSLPIPSTPSFEWLTITSNTLAVENKGYITNSLGRVEITLNSTNSGALTGVTGKDTGGWQIIVPAGKILRFDEIVIDNYLESNLSTDSVMIVYLGEDIYQVISSIGNLTYNLLSLPIP
jgi:hypothetical protein